MFLFPFVSLLLSSPLRAPPSVRRLFCGVCVVFRRPIYVVRTADQLTYYFGPDQARQRKNRQGLEDEWNESGEWVSEWIVFPHMDMCFMFKRGKLIFYLFTFLRDLSDSQRDIRSSSPLPFAYLSPLQLSSFFSLTEPHCTPLLFHSTFFFFLYVIAQEACLQVVSLARTHHRTGTIFFIIHKPYQ